MPSNEHELQQKILALAQSQVSGCSKDLNEDKTLCARTSLMNNTVSNFSQSSPKNRIILKQPSPFDESLYLVSTKLDSFQSFTTAKRLQALTSHSSSNTSLQSLIPSRSTTPVNNGCSLSPFISPVTSSTSSKLSFSSLEQDSIGCSILPSTPNSKCSTFLESKRPLTTSFLRPGVKFQGFQHSGHSLYKVSICLKEVDLNKGMINGTLTINGLTEAHPEIITYFEGDMVDESHDFITGDYDTSPEIDYAHWSRFPYFHKFGLNKFSMAQYKHRKALSHDMLYMRWKETFIYTDSKVESIEGASFAGFYYICFNQNTGEVKGYYYHKSSERFQKLELSIIEDPCEEGFQTYQFL